MTELSQTPLEEIRLEGIGASQGICIGKAYLVDREGVEVVPRYTIAQKQIQNEKIRFKSAVNKAKTELRAILENTPEDLREHSSLIEAHAVLLKDKMLYGKIIETIESKRVNAEWALKLVESSLKSSFRSMGDAYIQDRASDIEQVASRIMRSLTGTDAVSIAEISKRVILVATDLSPAETSQIQLERIKGFITDGGGKTSHTSIVARTLGIPAVLGLENATRMIRHDDLLVVDGTAGVVIINPTEQTLLDSEERRDQLEQQRALVMRSSRLPAVTTDGFRLPVMGNIELPEEVVSVKDNGGDGIGLYRTEFQYLGRPDFPTESELFDRYRDVIEVMAGMPVTIRTLDINGDKALAGSGGEDVNPALGLRAIRYCLKRPDIFTTQLRAILRAATYGPVRILLPMISGCEEIDRAKRMLDEAAESLERDGLPYDRKIDLGVMMEVPSAAIMADLLADAVDFFSIGTNDLLQYTLAIDRGNRDVAYLFNPLHPAIIRLIRHISDVSRGNDIPLAMCGEMAADPVHLPVLLGLGLDELSMSPQSIPVVKSFARKLDISEARAFIKPILRLKTTKAVTEAVMGTYGSLLAESSTGDAL
jgi:phosphotransferase system enzyme I (PtsI)